MYAANLAVVLPYRAGTGHGQLRSLSFRAYELSPVCPRGLASNSVPLALPLRCHSYCAPIQLPCTAIPLRRRTVRFILPLR
jgi:hypothetical protein